MMQSATPVVSVVIPAHNAQATLTETLELALRQTCRDIEVLVVDDGSCDSTPEIAEAYARRDPRVRVLRQANGGVARARNCGIRHSKGQFVSPLDADDLWHPQKLELQLKALARVPGAALAYNWSRFVDERGAVIGSGPRPILEGPVFHRHIMWNFIGNGSTPLIVAGVLQRVGYEPALRDRKREGAEDYLMQLLVAKDHAFACAPAYLTGYRRMAGTMSSDKLQMARSVTSMFAMAAGQFDGFSRELCRRQQAEYLTSQADFHLGRRAIDEAAGRLIAACRLDLGTGASWMLRRALRASGSRPEPHAARAPKPFTEQDPWKLAATWAPNAFIKLEARLANADGAHH